MTNLSRAEAKALLSKGWCLTHASWKSNEYIRIVGDKLLDESNQELDINKIFNNKMMFGWEKFDTNQHFKRPRRKFSRNRRSVNY